jgi:hypothetical protein
MESKKERVVLWGIEYAYEDGTWRIERDFPLQATRQEAIIAWVNKYGWMPLGRGRAARPVRLEVRRYGK